MSYDPVDKDFKIKPYGGWTLKMLRKEANKYRALFSAAIKDGDDRCAEYEQAIVERDRLEEGHKRMVKANVKKTTENNLMRMLLKEVL